jgi:hypothetical protein
MSAENVYCPKCGAQSTDGARFCRHCGTNLEVVSRALTGHLAPLPNDSALNREMEIEYAKEFSRAIYGLLGSIATFTVLMFIFKGAFWVYFLLFWVANNVRDVVQAYLLKRQITDPAAFKAAIEAYRCEKESKKKRKRREEREAQAALQAPQQPVSLYTPAPQSQPVYVPPARTTGEIKKPEGFEFDPDSPPPSVTEHTTELLDSETAEQTRRFVGRKELS